MVCFADHLRYGDVESLVLLPVNTSSSGAFIADNRDCVDFDYPFRLWQFLDDYERTSRIVSVYEQRLAQGIK